MKSDCIGLGNGLICCIYFCVFNEFFSSQFYILDNCVSSLMYGFNWVIIVGIFGIKYIFVFFDIYVYFDFVVYII